MNLLFDFMLGRSKRKARRAVSPQAKVQRPRAKATRRGAQYGAMVEELTKKYGIRVRKWRKSMSGVAWTMRSRDGAISRWIESPRPTGPVSCAIFLHEVGHHAIGLGVHKPRCLEEHLAWEWSLKEMERRGLTISEGVRRRVERSMKYAVSKAKRRGIKRLPVEVARYV